MSIEAVQPLYKRIESKHQVSSDEFKALVQAAGNRIGKNEYLAIRAVADSVITGRYNTSDDDGLDALARSWIAHHNGPSVYFSNGVMNLAMDPGRLLGAQLKGGVIGAPIGAAVVGAAAYGATVWGTAAAAAEGSALAFSWTGPGALIAGAVGGVVGAGVGWWLGKQIATVNEMRQDPNDPDNE